MPTTIAVASSSDSPVVLVAALDQAVCEAQGSDQPAMLAATDELPE